MASISLRPFADPRRARAAILVAWALLSTVSVWVALHRTAPALPVAIELTEVGGEALLLVRNASPRDWAHVRVTVDEDWFAERAGLASEGTWRLRPGDLHRAAGVPLELGDPWLAGAPGLSPAARRGPADLRIRAVRVEEGGRVVSATFDPPGAPAASP